MNDNSTRTFEDWIAHCFDQPVSETQGHYTEEAAEWQAQKEVALGFMTRLFTSSTDTLARFSDAQINQGFWYLVSNSASDYMYLLIDETLPEADRLACLKGLASLFAGIFSQRCTDAPSHHASGEGLSPLNSVCYMWFDVMPIHPMFGAARKNIDAAMLEVLEAILALDSLACQESALHGLGHWTGGDPDRIKLIVAAYLRRMPANHVLRSYAQHAATGNVQ